MKTRALPLILLLFFSFSCNDSTLQLDEDDYLIFGQFYGFCIGDDCIQLFRLESTRLLEDKNDNYPSASTFYNASYKVLSSEKFNKVKSLSLAFPLELLAENDTVIGQPDAGDWGGYYIEYSSKGVRKYWLIDKMRNSTPEYMHSFLTEVDEAILKIREE